jgi:hypothetical protein
MTSSSRKISNTLLTVTIAATLLTATLFTMSSNSPSVFAQRPPTQPQTTPPQLQQQQQQNAPLNFYLKLADNASAAQAAPQAAGSGTKNMTVTVNIQKGPGGQQIPLPISALVPANVQPQDLQLCASLADGSESCQPLSAGQQGAKIDLTQPGAAGGATPAPMGTASSMPAPSPVPAPPQTGQMSPMPAPAPAPAPQSYPNSGGDILANAINPIVETLTSTFTIQYASAQLIAIEDTTVNIPVTVIVPIDLNIQNAQVCASVLSGGSQSCTQVVLNPTQTSFTDVNVDLSSATPTLTTAEQEPTTALTTTTAEPTTTATEPLTTTQPTPTAPTTTTEPTAPTTTTEPTTEESNQLFLFTYLSYPGKSCP